MLLRPEGLVEGGLDDGFFGLLSATEFSSSSKSPTFVIDVDFLRESFY